MCIQLFFKNENINSKNYFGELENNSFHLQVLIETNNMSNLKTAHLYCNFLYRFFQEFNDEFSLTYVQFPTLR